VLVRALSRARTAAAAGPAHASSGTHGIPLDLACVIVSGTALFIRYMPMWTGTRCVYRYRCSSSKPNTLFVGYLSGLSSLCCAADALKSREDKKICRLSHCIWAEGGRSPVSHPMGFLLVPRHEVSSSSGWLVGTPNSIATVARAFPTQRTISYVFSEVLAVDA
jgi:hypothetical protein